MVFFFFSFSLNVESIGISGKKFHIVYTICCFSANEVTALFLHFSGTFSHDFPPTRNTTKVNGNSSIPVNFFSDLTDLLSSAFIFTSEGF